MLETFERRSAIIKTLCRRRYATMKNLADEFGVSERTIRRDIEVISLTEPIYTQTGRYGGGVYVMDGYYSDRLYMSTDEIALLNKVRNLTMQKKECFLNDFELNLLANMIKIYSKPEKEKENNDEN